MVNIWSWITSISGTSNKEFSIFSGISKDIAKPIKKYLNKVSGPNIDHTKRLKLLIEELKRDIVLAKVVLNIIVVINRYVSCSIR